MLRLLGTSAVFFATVLALTIAPIGPTLAADAKPLPIAPVNGAKLSDLGPTLRWAQDADSRWFQVQVVPFADDGPAINLIVGDPGMVAAASYQVQDPDFGSIEPNYVMLPDITYNWRVRTADTVGQPLEGDWSPWSDPRTFETANKGSSTISLTGNGTMMGSRTPTLQWNNTDDDVFYYEVQVSKDSNFCASAGCPMLYWELRHGGVTSPLNSYTIPNGFPLENDETYFWRVRPRIQGDGFHDIPWTASANFRTP